MRMDRLKQYEELLKDRKEYLYAIEEAEKEQTFEQDTRLYLRTMAPVLTEFAGWVLEQAVSAGKKRLYFRSRRSVRCRLNADTFMFPGTRSGFRCIILIRRTALT